MSVALEKTTKTSKQPTQHIVNLISRYVHTYVCPKSALKIYHAYSDYTVRECTLALGAVQFGLRKKIITVRTRL